MNRLRKSISFHRKSAKPAYETAGIIDNHRGNNSFDQASECWSSIDKLVIPQRTRYPSGNTAVPKPLDVRIARNLLEHASKGKDDSSSSQMPTVYPDQRKRQHSPASVFSDPPIINNLDGNLENPFEDNIPSRSISGNSDSVWSNFSLSADSSDSRRSLERDVGAHTRLYNALAKSYGIHGLEFRDKTLVEKPGLPKKSLCSSRSWLLNKLARTKSSINLPGSAPPLSKRESLSSLLGHHHQLSIMTKSLDDIFRLGGVSVLHLPKRYAAVPLIVPTCLAATANSLILHGKTTPGIFRIPGQSNVVNELYEHYAHRINERHDCEKIETTIGSLKLPHNVTLNVHDTASAFKKFLWDFPGGILGSVELFNALQEICSLKRSHKLSWSSPDWAKLVALALLSLTSKPRIALISAVFGLLAYLKQNHGESNTASISTPNGSEAMGSKALSVVFAPILLGNLTEHIKSGQESESIVDWNKTKAPGRGLFKDRKSGGKTESKAQPKNMEASIERNKECATVAECLIEAWEEVVKQISLVEVGIAFRKAASADALQDWDQNKILTSSAASTPLQNRSHEVTGCKAREDDWKALASRRDESVPVLPHPPSGELQFDPDIYETSSIALPACERENKIHVQIQTPSGRTHVPGSTYNLPLPGNSGHLRSVDTGSGCQSLMTCLGSLEKSDTIAPARVDSAGTAQILESSVSPTKTYTDDSSRDALFSAFKKFNADEVGNPLGEKELSSITKIERTPCTVDPTDPARKPSIWRGSNSRPQSMSKVDEIGPALSSSDHRIYESTNRHLQRNGQPSQSKSRVSIVPRPVTENFNARKGNTFPPAKKYSHASITYAKSSPLQNTERSHSYVAAEISPCKRRSSSADKFGIRQCTQSSDTAGTSKSRNSHQNYQMKDEPPVARRIDFGSLRGGETETKRSPNEALFVGYEAIARAERTRNVGTLYAEIRRLHQQLELKIEEIWQLKHELEAMKRFKDSRTLSKKLRDTEGEMRMWRYRAQRAEARAV